MEIRKQYQIQISNCFAAVRNVNDREKKIGLVENIRENVKITAKETLSLYEKKQHIPILYSNECTMSQDVTSSILSKHVLAHKCHLQGHVTAAQVNTSLGSILTVLHTRTDPHPEETPI
jgi:hypothetical protein